VTASVIDNFDAASRLGEAELRELVSSEDARTRLYAIWALGLRAASVVGHLQGEPDPGVRRGLAVVLAGQGEVDLLVALCRHDPNVHVRASTSQIVVRFAKAGGIPWSLVNERFADAPEVRAAVISQLDAACPPELRELALRGLQDTDEIVRREAFEVAVKLFAAGLADSARLRDGLERMTRGECTNALVLWMASSPPAAIALALVDASTTVRELAIRLRPDLAFTDLLPLLADDPDLFLTLAHKLEEPPLQLLVQVVAKKRERYDLQEEVVDRISAYERVPRDHAGFVAELRTRCAQRLAEIETVLVSLTDSLEDEAERDELEWSREVIEPILAKLARLRD